MMQGRSWRVVVHAFTTLRDAQEQERLGLALDGDFAVRCEVWGCRDGEIVESEVEGKMC